MSLSYEQLQHAAKTHVGMRRSHNQDSFAVQLARDPERFANEGHLFLVADGMGGHAVGEKASAKAAHDIPLMYQKYAREGPEMALTRAFQETNAGIFAIGQNNPEFKGLGTTGTALVVRPEGVWVGHVGDSRVYRIRNGRIEQLSFDHSYLWEMARKLGVPPEELPDLRKNVIIRSLGPDSLVEVDIEGPYPVQPGDIYVLCSDGLSNPVRSEEIGAIASHLPPDEACQYLIEYANLRGGPDNITAIVVRVPDDPNIPAHDTARKRGPSLWKRVWQWWFQRVPWSLTVLIVGFLLTILCLVMALEEIPGRTAVFVLALLTIMVGMVGLFIQSNQEQDEPEPRRVPGEEHIYRDYSCEVTPKMLEQLTELDTNMREFITERDWEVDWDYYQQQSELCAKALEAGQLADAFRARCRASMTLAAVINQHHSKVEGFSPKWEKTASEEA